jgi:hypothetical protein
MTRTDPLREAAETEPPSVAGLPANLSSDLLRGAAQIAAEIYGDSGRKAQRRLYHEQDRWPVFRLDDTGVLYALRSRLRAHLEMKSIEVEARIVAADNAKTTAILQSSRRRRFRRRLRT